MEDCIFCKIASGEIPAARVYDDDQVVAFDDLNPQAPTHVLVVPREHIERISDIDEQQAELVGRLFVAANQVAQDRNLDDYRLVMNCGEGAGQSVWHIHLHLLGGRNFSWPPG